MTEDTRPRRRFLQQAVALVPATTLAGGMVVSQTACSSDADRKAQNKPYTPTYFNQEEWAFINAAVDHLIPADDLGPGAVAAGVPEFIDRQMEDPYGHGKLWYMEGPFNTEQRPEMGYQLDQTPRDIYRNGIAGLNAWSRQTHGKVYAELDKTLQEQILHDLQGNKIKLDKVPATTFFSYLLANTKEGFFADPMYGGNKGMVGWKLVGFPGARGDFMDWVDQPNAKYPYGPVSISGEKG
ncbi:gluconate 2-dehydrogenase [Bordetella genomosp. 1]|uniref:Gluconate 2-dehydrogenase n=1 Tax=Bordetella genomosp. 1 TaxID=1395607 RepID=A0A261SF43_9BORD|nr:gluconate 2-dehydrogenase subunit 3 family protein [Bordetella genomosp. 1]MDQ8032118.1 gluconate 2-dehydrogenase subunit 3 family protein [Bordetella sp.]OZI35627.1 gluconate 2-dehydrogenase [Bordetella genomosp. 1]OZI64153.1 gluconate 2-dehydrogenase [Bordetella genomosp. 1]